MWLSENLIELSTVTGHTIRLDPRKISTDWDYRCIYLTLDCGTCPLCVPAAAVVPFLIAAVQINTRTNLFIPDNYQGICTLSSQGDGRYPLKKFLVQPLRELHHCTSARLIAKRISSYLDNGVLTKP